MLAEKIVLVTSEAFQLLLEKPDEVRRLDEDGHGFADGVQSVPRFAFFRAQVERTAVDLRQGPTARHGAQRAHGHRRNALLGSLQKRREESDDEAIGQQSAVFCCLPIYTRPPGRTSRISAPLISVTRPRGWPSASLRRWNTRPKGIRLTINSICIDDPSDLIKRWTSLDDWTLQCPTRMIWSPMWKTLYKRGFSF